MCAWIATILIQIADITASKTPILTLDIPGSPSLSDEKKVAAILGALPKSYTIIYTTTPPVHAANHPSYEPKFEAQEPLHVEMKRNVMSRRDNSTAPQVPKNAPLFEKYQFFTPGKLSRSSNLQYTSFLDVSLSIPPWLIAPESSVQTLTPCRLIHGHHRSASSAWYLKYSVEGYKQFECKLWCF